MATKTKAFEQCSGPAVPRPRKAKNPAIPASNSDSSQGVNRAHGSPPVAAYCDRAAETITRRIEFTSCIGIVSFPAGNDASIAAFYDSQKGLCQR